MGIGKDAAQAMSNGDRRFPCLRVRGRGQRVRWWLVWLVVLLTTGMAAGVCAAVSDPNWRGTKPKNVSESNPDLAWQPAVAAASGHVLVAWSDQETQGEYRDVHVSQSDNAGFTWSTPEVISATTFDSLLPDALFVGDRRFVAWIDGQPPKAIYETEVGTTSVRAIPSPVQLTGTRPRLAVGAGRLHVVFNAGVPDSQVYYTSRALADTAWPTAKRVYTSTGGGASWMPALAVGPDGETLHLVWKEYTIEVQVIMYMSGTVSGDSVSWFPAVTLSEGITTSVRPALVVDSTGTVHAAWGEVGPGGRTEEQYVRYARCINGSCTSAVRVDAGRVMVNDEDPTFVTPDLALLEEDGQVTICVAWHGFREGGAAEEVLLSCSDDGGQSWSSSYNVSRSPGDVGYPDVSIMPSIASDEMGQLHGAWQERVNAEGKDSYYEVYYSRTLGNLVFLPFVTRNGQ